MAPDRGSSQVKRDSARAWDSLSPPLSGWVLEALASMSFTKMTPVQASTIPLFMGHKDVVVEAVTGSGKTFAFLIPIVERILRLEERPKRHHVAAIVISPTRELATQIYKVLSSLLDFHGPSSANLKKIEKNHGEQEVSDGNAPEEDVYPADTPKIVPQLLVGGSSSVAQDLSKFLKMSPNVLISTPGRLLEILSSPYVHCPQSSFEVLVLDEADRLLDLGFKDDITKIIAFLPKQRRTGLFSASVSEAVDQIIRVGLRNPVRIAVKVKSTAGVLDKKTPASLRMTYVVGQASHKLPTLNKIMNQLSPRPLRTIVYLSTCAAVDYFQSLIPLVLPPEFQLIPLHGKHPSNVREKNFARFINSTSPVMLLTTDVAARGLDVPEVDLVIQIDPPSDPKAFLHRCGRAGRAGRKGLSIVFLQPGHEEDYVSFLEVRKTPIEDLDMAGIKVTDDDAINTTRLLQNAVLKDRSLHDKAQKAFVSWVRSYSKHQASSIFRLIDQDWADLAAGWALLRMPKMPELKNWDKSLFSPPDMSWETYKYLDKQREKQRVASLSAEAAKEHKKTDTAKNKKRDVSQAWSDKVERRTDRATKRSKKEAKREFERQAKLSEKEKADEVETEMMIQAIRRQNLHKENHEFEFEGFD